ncbi:MAG: hypothetical protein ABIT38_00280, partial [Gemmatimonadaceae bacterium]
MSRYSECGRAALGAAALLASLGAAPALVQAQQVTIDRWLVLGPTPAPLPFGAASSDSARLEALRIRLEHLLPAEGSAMPAPGAGTLKWQSRNGASAEGAVLYALSYVTSDRWSRASLQVTGGDTGTRRVWMDGARVSGTSVTLAQGKHTLVVERLGKGAEATTPLVATLTPTLGTPVLTPSLDPKHAATYRELRDLVAVNDVALDPAATRVAYTMRHQDATLDRSVGAMEVRDVASGRLLAQVNGEPASPFWSRDGSKLAYLAPSERHDVPGRDVSGRDVMVWDASSGATTRVMTAEPVASLVGWSPDGEWIYYTGTVRPGTPDVFKAGEARRFTEVWQRFGTSPDKAHLFAANVRQGTRYAVVGDSSFGVAGAALSP